MILIGIHLQEYIFDFRIDEEIPLEICLPSILHLIREEAGILTPEAGEIVLLGERGRKYRLDRSALDNGARDGDQIYIITRREHS